MIHNMAAATDESQNLESFKALKIGRPSRQLSLIPRCLNSGLAVAPAKLDLDMGLVNAKSSSNENSEFHPIYRSACCAEIGPKPYMEDAHICIDDLPNHIGAAAGCTSPGAFYGVFDGHGGTDAAFFVRENILRLIVEDSHFPICKKQAIKSAFLKADHAFVDDGSLDSTSGTTVLVSLIFGRKMFIANAGDCRAVLGKGGKAIDLSKDHKPNSHTEKLRIENLGGAVYDCYLNGELSVSRALGDWHMKGSKSFPGPLVVEPDIYEMVLTEEDEFLILGCDGLWDVMSSQCAVTIVRNELMLHNDPERCSRELVREAFKRSTRDNLTAIVVCFSPDPPPRIEVSKSKIKRSVSEEELNILLEV